MHGFDLEQTRLFSFRSVAFTYKASNDDNSFFRKTNSRTSPTATFDTSKSSLFDRIPSPERSGMAGVNCRHNGRIGTRVGCSWNNRKVVNLIRIGTRDRGSEPSASHKNNIVQELSAAMQSEICICWTSALETRSEARIHSFVDWVVLWFVLYVL